jgi:hypothetical protein
VKWVGVKVGRALYQGERPVKVVTTSEGAQRRPTASEGGWRRSMAKAEHPVKAAVRVEGTVSARV